MSPFSVEVQQRPLQLLTGLSMHDNNMENCISFNKLQKGQQTATYHEHCFSSDSVAHESRSGNAYRVMSSRHDSLWTAKTTCCSRLSRFQHREAANSTLSGACHEQKPVFLGAVRATDEVIQTRTQWLSTRCGTSNLCQGCSCLCVFS